MVARALRDQLPLLLASGIGVLNVLVDQAIAGLLPAGAISGLSYGYSLNGIIAQCVVMSLGWVALPEFASLYASGEMSRLVERARECIRGVVLVAAPLTVLVIAAGYTAVKLTFQHGAFNASSTHLVYQTWAGYTVGLVPFAVGMMGVRMLNAIHEQRSLAKIAALMLPFNAGLDYLFMRQWGVFGISLSTSLVYCLTTWLILKLLRRRTGVSLMDAPTKAVLRRTFSLTALAGLVFVPVHYLHAHSALAVVTTTAANVALVLLLYRHARLLPITAAPVVRNV
jgi:putative peptidoglycan lipid II flippase